MNHFFKRVRNVHENRDGQAMLVIALVMFTIVCFLAFTINVGHRITAKVEMQNAADAAVMSGAIWEARGMNMISILNVGMTECLALIIMFRAFQKTYEVAEIALPICEAAALAVAAIPYVGAALSAAWQALLRIARAAMPAIKAAAEVMDNLAKDDGALWSLMKVLQNMSKGIKTAAPIVAAYEAHTIAGLNGADPWVNVGGFTYRALFLPFVTESLPVQEGEFKDLCKPTVGDGGHHYEEYLDWQSAFSDNYNALGMSLPDLPILGSVAVQDLFAFIYGVVLIGIIPNPGIVYKVYVQVLANSICSGETGFDNPEGIEKMTTNCSECDPEKHEIKKEEWVTQPQWFEISSSAYTDCDMPAAGAPKTPSSYIDRSVETVKTINASEEPCEKCKIIKVTYTVECYCSDSDPACKNCSGDPKKGTKTIVAYYKTDHKVLKKCIYLEAVNESISTSGDKPKPLMLKDDWEKYAKYTAVVKKEVGDRVTIGGGDSEDSEDSTWATAQAEMYNPTNPYMFNQDWEVRLKPWKAEDVNLSVLGFDVMQKLPDSIKNAVSTGIGQFLVH